MDLIEESLSSMTFSLNTPWIFPEITLSIEALNVLMEINGHNNLGFIGKKLGMTLQELQQTVNELGRMKLITRNGKNGIQPNRTTDSPIPATRKKQWPVPTGDSNDHRTEKGLYRGVRY